MPEINNQICMIFLIPFLAELLKKLSRDENMFFYYFMNTFTQ